MNGNRAVNNNHPLHDQIKAQQAAYIAAGGSITPVPLGQGSGSLAVPLSAPENRRKISKDMGKFFND